MVNHVTAKIVGLQALVAPSTVLGLGTFLSMGPALSGAKDREQDVVNSDKVTASIQLEWAVNVISEQFSGVSNWGSCDQFIINSQVVGWGVISMERRFSIVTYEVDERIPRGTTNGPEVFLDSFKGLRPVLGVHFGERKILPLHVLTGQLVFNFPEETGVDLIQLHRSRASFHEPHASTREGKVVLTEVRHLNPGASAARFTT